MWSLGPRYGDEALELFQDWDSNLLEEPVLDATDGLIGGSIECIDSGALDSIGLGHTGIETPRTYCDVGVQTSDDFS